MPRTVRDSKLETRRARERLPARNNPYFRAIEPGLHLGYRKPKGRRGQKVAGSWICRLYVGDQSYRVERLGIADDFSDADGIAILDFKKAQDEARQLLVRHAWETGGVARGGKHKRVANCQEGPLTVRKAVEDYIIFLEHARKSAQDARYRANALIYPELGAVPVDQLTSNQIRDWLAEIAKRPPRLRTKKGDLQRHRDIQSNDPEAIRRRRASANRTLTVLKAALNRQWREGHVASNGAWSRVEPFEGVDAARVRYLSVSEAQRLINASDPAFRLLVEAALYTGARYGELARLEVSDFNPDSETIAIRLSKNGKPRHVELSEEGVEFFRRLTIGRAGNEILLRTNSGGSWRASHQNRPMVEACRRASIVPPMNFHGTRHTWASHAVMNGVPLLVVAKNLGHCDTRMVERHYGHLAPSYVRDAIRAGAPRFGVVPSNVLPLRA